MSDVANPNPLGRSGDIDLTNCDREPIHIPGCIQPHGVLLVLDADDLSITQVSDNARSVIGIEPEDLLSQPIETIVSEDYQESLRQELRNEMVSFSNPLQVPVDIDGERTIFDAVVNRRDQLVLLELENPHSFNSPSRPVLVPNETHFRLVRKAITEMYGAAKLEDVCDILVEQVRDFTGFDRVMVYRFAPDGHGSVIAEASRQGIETFLGLHYPASDIPQQARRLYEINWLRLIVDTDYQPAMLTPAINPVTNATLDMSQSVLRSVSPIHVQYLKNMGVSASTSISLLNDGKLWGLIACHHYSPKFVPYDVRAGCELLGCVMSLQLTTKEFSEQAIDQARQQSLHGELLSMVSRNNSVISLTDEAETLLKLVDAQGATVLFNGESRSVGMTPDDLQVDALIQWLRSREETDVFTTDSLPSECPAADAFAAQASGLLAVTLSRFRGDYILFFRPEVEQTVHWAGNPEKPVEVSDDGEKHLTPRTSFDIWKQTVKGKSFPWRQFEIEIARELRNSLVTFIIQRAEELDQINRELQRSNIELDSFAYVASHDLKEPLRGINGFAYYISEHFAESLSDIANQKVQGIMRLTKRMDDLLNSLLHFSRVGRMEINRQRINMDELLSESLEMISECRIDDGGVVDVPRPLPFIACDATRVREVFCNLIANGLKYNEANDRRIEVGYVDREDPDAAHPDPWVFYVRDNGIGIKSTFHDRIFQMFKRLHGQDLYGGGAGAGLTIVRKIVERHGGRVWLESEPGQGSTFYFTLQPENGEA